MGQTIDAVFDGQVLRPDEPIPLAPNTRVRITIELSPSVQPRTPLGRQLRELRTQLIASGEPLWNWEEIDQEVARLKGEAPEAEHDSNIH